MSLLFLRFDGMRLQYVQMQNGESSGVSVRSDRFVKVIANLD